MTGQLSTRRDASTNPIQLVNGDHDAGLHFSSCTGCNWFSVSGNTEDLQVNTIAFCENRTDQPDWVEDKSRQIGEQVNNFLSSHPTGVAVSIAFCENRTASRVRSACGNTANLKSTNGRRGVHRVFFRTEPQAREHDQTLSQPTGAAASIAFYENRFNPFQVAEVDVYHSFPSRLAHHSESCQIGGVHPSPKKQQAARTPSITEVEISLETKWRDRGVDNETLLPTSYSSLASGCWVRNCGVWPGTVGEC
ncbi:hypothetical protein B0H19DRAFT_1073536 [Mycena capillaripes]|nr:hypothetical protein B0H19DRAFT_1073536 [Mycena capillaripes]